MTSQVVLISKIFTNNMMNRKIDMSNEDHRRSCGKYIKTKI